jgi:hypothetical protein
LLLLFSRSLLLHSVSFKLLLLLPHIHCKYHRFLFLLLLCWLAIVAQLSRYKQPSLPPELTGFRLRVLYMRARRSSQNFKRTQGMRCKKKKKYLVGKRIHNVTRAKKFQSSPVHFENQEANNWKNSQYAFKIQLLV